MLDHCKGEKEKGDSRPPKLCTKGQRLVGRALAPALERPKENDINRVVRICYMCSGTPICIHDNRILVDRFPFIFSVGSRNAAATSVGSPGMSQE